MKKILLTSLLAAFFISAIGIASAQTPQVTSVKQLDSALLKFREIKDRFSRTPNDFSVRRDHLLRVLDVLRARSEAHKSKGVAIDVIKELTTDISSVDKLKDKVSSAKSIEELKTIAREVKSHRDSDKVLRKAIHSYIAHLRGSLTAAKNRSERLERAISDLETNKIDVASLKSLLSGAKAKIATIEEGLASLEKRVNSTTKPNLTEIRDALKDFVKMLKEAFTLFEQIIKGIQEARS